MTPQMESQWQDYYKSRFVKDANRERVWKHIARFLNGYLDLNENCVVLELGAGYGSWIRNIPCKKRVALDLNPDIKKHFQSEGLDQIQTYVGDCTNLEMFANGSIDIVLASNLLEHLEYDEVERCLGSVYRVLKANGRFCIVQPNFSLCPKQYFDDFTHKTIFTDNGLADWLATKGFQVLHKWKRFLPFSMKSGGLAAKLDILVPLYLHSPWKPMAGQMALVARKLK